MRKYILYHAQCPDGFGAAYAAWKVWGNQAEYIPVSHHYPPPFIELDAEIYIVDFCYPKNILLELAQKASKLVVLDHHKTAEADLQDIPLADFPHLFITFDMQKSGAVLAWEHFHTTPVPELLKYIQDKDLWLFQLPFSKEITAALRGYEMNFEIWDKLEVNNLKQEGVILLQYQNQLVEKLCKNVRFIQVANYEVPAVNSSILQSEIGNKLCTLYPKNPFAVVYFDSADKRHFSLRSVGTFDVAQVAQKYGGGGHQNASGFSTKLLDIRL